jgi:hypothetical protein
MEIQPSSGVFLLAIILGFIYSVFRVIAIPRKKNILAKPAVRLWLAITITWCSAVFVYCLIFESGSTLNREEFILLALLPPIVLAIGKLSWYWAHNPSSKL